MKINIYSDIHGRYNTFLELKKNAPKSQKEIFVGDLIHRGRNSVKMMEYILKNNSNVVIGNHEALYLSYKGLRNKFLNNVSDATIKESKKIYLSANFGFDKDLNESKKDKLFIDDIDNFFINLPIEINIDNIRITHAPPSIFLTKDSSEKDIYKYMFHRPNPLIQIKDKLSIFGHNGNYSFWTWNNGLAIEKDIIFKNKGNLGEYICIDSMKDYLSVITIDTETLEYEITKIKGDQEWK